MERFIDDIFDITRKKEYHFRQLYGFTFVIKRDIVFLNDQLTSAQIEPVGIIYEENDQYYLAPLCVIEDIDEVVKEYVKKCMK